MRAQSSSHPTSGIAAKAAAKIRRRVRRFGDGGPGDGGYLPEWMKLAYAASATLNHWFSASANFFHSV